MPKNAFTDFKNRYAGRDTVAKELTEDAARQMAEIYDGAYNRIFRAIATAKRGVNYADYAKKTELLKQIGAELDRMRNAAGEYFRKAIRQATAYASASAIRDIELIGGEITNPKAWHAKFNSQYAEQTFKDAFLHVAGQTDKMAEDMKAMLRQETAMISRRAAVEGLSRRKAYRLLKAQIEQNDPEFQFVDRAGRPWDSRRYFDMLTRTVMATTLNEAYVNTLVNEGKDLAKISRSGATDACSRWEGKIISLTGATQGYPTLSEVKATKEIFHPRCTHRLLAYNKEIDDVFAEVND